MKEFFKLFAQILIIALHTVFVILPASLGYWYIIQDESRAFKIPTKFWIIPTVITIAFIIIFNLN